MGQVLFVSFVKILNKTGMSHFMGMDPMHIDFVHACVSLILISTL